MWAFLLLYKITFFIYLSMVLINKASVNIICLTLTEKTTIPTPTYLFSFTNPQSNITKSFISEDISDYTDRYNKFSITEKVNPIYLNSEVDLPIVGFYDYIIYAQSSTTNLDPTLATEIVEKGKVYVNPSSVVDNAPTTALYDTIKTYNE